MTVNPIEVQYANSANLNARINLHAKYSTNKYGWSRWVFDQYDFKDNFRILELGCGNGAFWKVNSQRIPTSWDVTLSDFSQGMLNDAKIKLSEVNHLFKFAVVDVQDIPFENEIFDVVIANHMLYHVPDRQKAFAEIKRILKGSGKLYATTFGFADRQELNEIVMKFDQAIKYGTKVAKEFGLETGPAQLEECFINIDIKRYADSLEITDAQPLIDYVLSSEGLSNVTDIISGNKLAEFKKYIENIIVQNGMFKVTKDSGMIIADKRL